MICYRFHCCCGVCFYYFNCRCALWRREFSRSVAFSMRGQAAAFALNLPFPYVLTPITRLSLGIVNRVLLRNCCCRRRTSFLRRPKLGGCARRANGRRCLRRRAGTWVSLFHALALHSLNMNFAVGTRRAKRVHNIQTCRKKSIRTGAVAVAGREAMIQTVITFPLRLDPHQLPHSHLLRWRWLEIGRKK